MPFSTMISPLHLSLSIAILAGTANIAFADPLNEKVRARGTLSGIVDKNYPNSDLTQAQIMIAVLAANPHAFKEGNINFMLRDKELTLPSEDMISAIPANSAASLLVKHNAHYKLGETGNLTAPTFINTGNSKALEQLKSAHSQQTEKVEKLTGESKKLQGLVSRLEEEKAQRDRDLQALEDKIQRLKDEGNTADSFGEEKNLSSQYLIDKNEVLQQRLIETRSELAENNRTTISLERRVADMQAAQAQSQDKNISPVVPNVTRQEQAQPAIDTVEPVEPIAEVVDAPATDLKKGNVVEPANTPAGFDMSKLTWLLPLIAIIIGLALFLMRFFGKKKHEDLNLDEVDDYDFATPKMSVEQRNALGETADRELEPNIIATDAPLEVSIKLDVARAYMDAKDNQSAYEMLHEVLIDGNGNQQLEAKRLLDKL